jgi:hypothetical protein
MGFGPHVGPYPRRHVRVHRRLLRALLRSLVESNLLTAVEKVFLQLWTLLRRLPRALVDSITPSELIHLKNRRSDIELHALGICVGSTQLAPPHPHTISHTTKIDGDTPRTVQTCQWPLSEKSILSIKYSSVYRPSTQTPLHTTRALMRAHPR